MAQLTYRAVELRTLALGTGGLLFTITKGWSDTAEVRGEPDVAPTKEGQYEASGWYKRDHLDIRLHGYVIGQGATEVLAQQSLDALTTSLRAIFRSDLLAGTLQVTAPFMGLASGTATIAARYLNALWAPRQAGFWQEVDVDLRCIADPPDWVRVP